MKASAGTEKLFDIVNDEVTLFVFDVIAWRDLFNAETISILNRRTGNIFRVLQNRLYDGHHIRIARLVETPRGDRGGASAYALAAAVRRDGLDDLARRMSLHLRSMKKLARGIEWRRDKLIGHVDLEARLGTVQPPGGEPTFDVVEEIARCASAFVNEYASEIRDTTIAHDLAEYLRRSGSSDDARHIDASGAGALIRELELAERYRRENPGHWMPPRLKAALHAGGDQGLPGSHDTDST